MAFAPKRASLITERKRQVLEEVEDMLAVLSNTKHLKPRPPEGGLTTTPCRARTCDPLIKSQLLYQLS